MATEEGDMCRSSVEDESVLVSAVTSLDDELHQKTLRIVSCGVFRPSLEHLRFQARFLSLRITYLLSNLHINPARLHYQLKQEVIASNKRGERVICLYGECFSDMDLFCDENGIARVKGHHCYEILSGAEDFRRIIDENPRSYFLERDLIINFEEYCIRPLELEDMEMRDCFFRNYERLVYIRQPSDPDLIPSVKGIADLLELPFITLDADYSNLENMLVELIDKGRSAK